MTAAKTVRNTRVVNAGNSQFIDVMMCGDTHIGDSFRDPRYMQFIQKWVNAEKNRYVILTGDLFNAAIMGSKSDIYEEEFTLNGAMAVATEWLSSFSNKVVANIDGNHDQRVDRSVGIDPVEHVSREAGCLYDGMEAYVSLSVGTSFYDIYVTHGVGGGRTQGGKINNLMRLREIVVADCYVQGHQHDPVIKPGRIQRISQNHRHVEMVDQLFIVTPGGLKRGGYAVAKAYAPTGWGIPVVRFFGSKKCMEPRLIDIV